MATIHSLALETLINIINLAHDPCKPSTMKSAALVCRAWRDPAQRNLFLEIGVPAFVSGITFKLYRWDRYLSDATGVGQELERLTLHRIDWDHDWHPFGHLWNHTWPENLRFLRIDAYRFNEFLRQYSPATSLVSLALDIYCKRDTILINPITFIPPSILELSFTIINPHAAGPAIGDLLTFLAEVQNLHHLTFQLKGDMTTLELLNMDSLLQALAGSLPASIKRMSVKNLSSVPGPVGLPLQNIPFGPIMELSAGDLPNLARLDLPDCKRKDLEDEAAAADLLADCERRSIRIVCWEEFL
ncbi:hypothetical protein RQP46_011147 [Phenoliferia psychrophenolica]